MPDMLVKLYALPDQAPLLADLRAREIIVRRGLAPEKNQAVAWVRQHFQELWASECDVAFARQPVACFIAFRGETLLGFACYDSTRRGLFGPIGVSEAARGQHIGRALLLACLHDMWAQGYAYAIIGGAGPTAFYAEAVGATVIEGSVPGIFGDLLRG